MENFLIKSWSSAFPFSVGCTLMLLLVYLIALIAISKRYFFPNKAKTILQGEISGILETTQKEKVKSNIDGISSNDEIKTLMKTFSRGQEKLLYSG